MKKTNLSTILKQEIQKCIDAQYADLVLLDAPPQPQFGEFSTNIAMVLAKHLKKSPAIIAQEIKEKLEKSPEFQKYFEAIIPEKSTYINFYIKPGVFPRLVQEIANDSAFGKGEKKNKKILIEFISANPTGPLHLGNGRGGFTGDCLANVLRLAGFDVFREYYINDVGTQIERLGKSVLQAAGIDQPDKKDLYQGLYISALADELKPGRDENAFAVGKRAGKIMLKNIQRVVMEKMRIQFDKWYSEESLYTSKKINTTFQWLMEKKLIYQKDGAWWFSSSRFGDQKDRVIIKSNGDHTYFFSDIAYHKDKFDRGFDKLITIFGADHHGYVGRIQAIIEALGHSKNKIDFILVQLVRLVEKGIEIKMSKRSGTFVTIEELIDEVGHDVVRFFFVMRAPETHLDFDLNLAKEHSNKNPVYYVQYAHARICSILNKVRDYKLQTTNYKLQTIDEYAPNTHQRNLAAHLMRFPDLIEDSAKTYSVHHLPAYAIKLADLFHRFYEHCRVIEGDKIHGERLKLIQATQIVLKNVLTVIGAFAPQRM